jgi:hypothetical protein
VQRSPTGRLYMGGTEGAARTDTSCGAAHPAGGVSPPWPKKQLLDKAVRASLSPDQLKELVRNAVREEMEQRGAEAEPARRSRR